MAGRVVKAAIWVGKLVCIGERHGVLIQELIKAGHRKKIMQDQQGFIDEDGEYLDRKQAYQRAVECGQIEDAWDNKKLLSEMVW